MKKLIIVVLVLTLAGGAVFAQNFRNGNHTGTAPSYNSPTSDPTGGSITVRVTVQRNRITAITVTQHTDSEQWVSMFGQQVIDRIIAAQSPDVDVVAGATGTSRGIMAAVRNALGL